MNNRLDIFILITRILLTILALDVVALPGQQLLAEQADLTDHSSRKSHQRIKILPQVELTGFIGSQKNSQHAVIVLRATDSNRYIFIKPQQTLQLGPRQQYRILRIINKDRLLVKNLKTGELNHIVRLKFSSAQAPTYDYDERPIAPDSKASANRPSVNEVPEDFNLSQERSMSHKAHKKNYFQRLKESLGEDGLKDLSENEKDAIIDDIYKNPELYNDKDLDAIEQLIFKKNGEPQ